MDSETYVGESTISMTGDIEINQLPARNVQLIESSHDKIIGIVALFGLLILITFVLWFSDLFYFLIFLIYVTRRN